MVLKPNDFQNPSLSLEDFPAPVKSGAVLGDKTSSQQSATRALLSGQSAEEYRQGVSEVKFPETRGEFLSTQREVSKGVWEDSKSSLLQVVIDESVPEEDKIEALRNVQSGDTPELFWQPNTMQRLAESTIVAPAGEDATPASEVSRDLMVPRLKEVMEAKRRTQAAINAYAASRDPSGMSAVGDIGELMVPFAEWIYFSRLQGRLLPGDEQRFWLGQQKQAVFDSLKDRSAAERAEITQGVIDYIDSNDQVLLPDGNDLIVLETLENMLIENDYSDTERWFDNVVSILDISGLVGILGKAGKAAKGTKRAGDVAEEVDPVGPDLKVPDVITPEVDPDFAEAAERWTRTDVDPASPSQIIRDTNPEAARLTHDFVNKNGDEAAQAMYGSNKNEAMAKDILPEPGDGTSTANKVEMSRPHYEEDTDIKKARRETGNLEVTDSERDAFRGRLVGRYEDVEGMKLHENSLSVNTKLDGTFGITARYNPVDYGFKSVSEARAAAQFAFRSYGLPDDAFGISIKSKGPDGVQWSKVDGEALDEGGEYAITVDYDYRLRPEDLEIEEVLTTRSGLFTSVGDESEGRGGFVTALESLPASDWLAKMGQGSLVQNLLDPSSVIHSQIVQAASVSVDKAYKLKDLYVEQFAGFTDLYKKLKKAERLKVSDYIHQANFEGIPFDIEDLLSRKFSSKQIEALKSWRKANDMMWYALNDDMSRTLRVRGYKSLVHTSSDTKLIGRPTKSFNGQTKAFDPSTNSVVSLNSLDETFKEMGGEVIELKNPIQIDGSWVDHAISRNTPESGYLREIYDGEIVMPYRDGYYPVMYDANYFVEKIVTMDDGRTKKVVIASAKTRNEVRHLQKRLMDTENLTEQDYHKVYSFRKDKAIGFQNQMFDEGSWSLASASNMTSQRLRGERLIDAGTDLHKMGYSNLKDPLEAIANQVHNLAQRTYARDFFETTKNRWMQSYGKYFDLPVNKVTGRAEYPSSIAGLIPKSNAPRRMVAAAKTNFNYIYSMENGYINGMDAGYRGALHLAAEALGEMGFGKTEELLFDAAKISPVSAAKSAAFKLFIAGNPARQAIIQRAQMLMLPVANPEYFLKDLAGDMIGINNARAWRSVGKKPKNKVYDDLLSEIEAAGILQAVDAHNLIRTDSLHLADITFAQRVGRVLNYPLKQMQKIGFDWSEQDVLISAWLTFRDKAIRAGLDINDQRVKDLIIGQAREYTLNMNRSGDMPYTHNTLGIIGQFMTHQHKALLQPVFNKSLSRKQRATMLFYSTALFGVDATMIGGTGFAGYSIVDAVVNSWFGDEQPHPAKDAIKNGALDYVLNQTLTVLSGGKQAIDWGDLAPTSAYGIGESLLGMISTDLTEVIAGSPSGSLLFGNNARVAEAYKSAARHFAPWEPDLATDPEGADYLLETTSGDVFIASLNMFSGFSNAFKARYAFQTGKKMSSSGRISDSDVTKVEAVMATLGFRTKDETGVQEMYKHIFGGSQDFTENDVEAWYGELKRHLARRGDSVRESNIRKAVLGEAWRVFGEDRSRAAGEVARLIERDSQNGDHTVLKGLLYSMDYMEESEWWKIINKLPDNEVRQRATDAMNTRKEFINDTVRD